MHLDENQLQVSEEHNEPDFFKEHENFDLHRTDSSPPVDGSSLSASSSLLNNVEKNSEKFMSEVASNSLGPTVKLSDPTTNLISERKSTIGVRKVQNKRPGVSV